MAGMFVGSGPEKNISCQECKFLSTCADLRYGKKILKPPADTFFVARTHKIVE